MALRVARRLCAPAPKGLGLEESYAAGWTRALNDLRSFSFRGFFEERNFWHTGSTGGFWLIVFTAPLWYPAAKEFYWTGQYKQYEKQEILSDRFTWLHERMLEDEIEKVLMKQVPREGFQTPALSLGPDEP
ncbi:unnamed protein product [Vitrella brassicaformis CCMP3155]|uniref:Uncharacterized protein n=1 Tax=Vitrella brassicaformis (strain CCMP3155) TaxID=1169540 RepID=A0A0G4FTF5_VITBC|nr:unnamed protein product [Vitrella brassicaformis CCMP3155]|mmetsp:Transcript_22110/g.54361  ORF Transcript_22110/g.54361 Transcript_22110/m.54361 type:complete len:131 (-) Transcript_22110:1678-2070(-)|eukprot:CEM17638.1 unnamed protein product [Vitrella brassicaformis CCMP3155]